MTSSRETKSRLEKLRRRVLFSPGTVLATVDALQALHFNEVTPQRLLGRHTCGDWGDLPLRARHRNEAEAVTGAGTVTSRYRLDDGELVLVTTEVAEGRTIISQPGDDKHMERYGVDWRRALHRTVKHAIPWFLIPISWEG